MDPNFFGLSGNPFAQSDTGDAPCLAEEHLALSAELSAGLKAPHGITLLIGDQGTGKSTFIRSFLAQLPESYVTAYLPTAGPGLRHLLTEIIEQLGGTVTPGGQEQALIDTVRSLAKARAEHDRATVVVIDDAHELPAKTIERLGKLFGPDAADPSRLHVTLVGQPELLDRMNAANDRSILKHLVQVCRMDAIGPEDAFRYIADRVQKVGGIVDRLFSEDALRLIVQRADGNPAKIDHLCAGALERAQGRGVSVVDAAAVEAVSNGAASSETSGVSVASDDPETPTYFFNEDDEDQHPVEGNASMPTTPRTLPREGAPVAVPASRRRLAYWAAGAIAAVIAVAWAMTGTDLPLGGDQGRTNDAPVQTAAKEKPRQAAEAGAGAAGAGTEEQGAVPKLVVKRGAKASSGETPASAATESKVAAVPGTAAGAQPAPEAAARPRFPAPPLEPEAEAQAKQGADQAAPAAADAALPTSVPAAPPEAATAKPTAAPTEAPKPAAELATAAPAAPATKTEPTAAVPSKTEPAAPAAMVAEKAAAPQPKPAVAPVAPTRPAASPKPTVAPPAPVQAAAAKPQPAARAAASQGAYTVQLGAFSSRANAEALLAKARPAVSDGRIVASTAGGKSVFRVVAGNFATQAEANARAASLKKSGYTTFVRKLD